MAGHLKNNVSNNELDRVSPYNSIQSGIQKCQSITFFFLHFLQQLKSLVKNHYLLPAVRSMAEYVILLCNLVSFPIAATQKHNANVPKRT